MSGGRPPIRTRCETPYLPEGFRSARTGTCLPIRVKSSIESRTSAEWAIARRWRTAFVEPPSAITTAIAFSNALRVMMSRGLMPAFRSASAASPARRQSAASRGPRRAASSCSEGSSPSPRWPQAIVLAVYMPPQEPGPGNGAGLHARGAPASSSAPAECWPTASKTETMSHSLFEPGWMPGRMVPP